MQKEKFLSRLAPHLGQTKSSVFAAEAEAGSDPPADEVPPKAESNVNLKVGRSNVGVE